MSTRGPRRILVVEDENIVAMDIQRGLKRMGYEVPAMVGSGDDAIRQAEALKPDLILMDIQIRGTIDGIETARRIWDQFHIPVIFLTAYADQKTLERAKFTEPFGYMLKPFEETELHTAIEVALQKHYAVKAREESQDEALALSEERFKLMVESVQDYGIYMLDPEGQIVSWNEGARRNHGYTSEEILGKNFAVLHTEEDQRAGRPARNLQYAIDDGHWQEEGVRVRQDGTRFWASVTVTPLRDKRGELRGFAKITRDISERKATEEKLQQTISSMKDALRSRDDFISIASHELKTPITSMKLQTQGLVRTIDKGGVESVKPEQLTRTLTRWLTQLDRLTRLVEDMLEISQIGEGKLTVERTDCDLSTVVHEVAERCREQLVSAGITLSLELEPGVIGQWDSFRIDQVVTNLLSNAIKYAPGHPVKIVVGKVGANAVMTVSDHGAGVPESAQTRIFELFERAVTVNNISGMGLGLYIARYMVRLHGGTIDLDSTPGTGAKFTVTLPLLPASA